MSSTWSQGVQTQPYQKRRTGTRNMLDLYTLKIINKNLINLLESNLVCYHIDQLILNQLEKNWGKNSELSTDFEFENHDPNELPLKNFLNYLMKRNWNQFWHLSSKKNWKRRNLLKCQTAHQMGHHRMRKRKRKTKKRETSCMTSKILSFFSLSNYKM